MTSSIQDHSAGPAFNVASVDSMLDHFQRPIKQNIKRHRWICGADMSLKNLSNWIKLDLEDGGTWVYKTKLSPDTKLGLV